MASRSVRAAANASMRSKAMIVISVFTVLMLFSIVMAIYDIANGILLFGLLFALAAFIFIILTLLKVNSVFGTYIKVKNNTLYMKSWTNGFLPYNPDGGLFSDMKPSKTKLIEIPADEISVILIGTKDFIKRNATTAGKKLARALYPFEHSAKRSRKKLISTIDLFYVETKDGECSYMCIYGYDPKTVVDVIGRLYKLNPDLYCKVNSREYRRHVMKLQSR
ncbi:MAG: hypothetical protein J1G06_04165 [Oscillospiraceae bacterium]|nr:hypothetical protein [Oscillospiraceae bacterium]